MKLREVLWALRSRYRFPDELNLVARGARHSFVLQGVGLGLGYAVHVLLARWLGATQYGVYTFVIAWGALLAVLAGLGFPLLAVRFVPEYHVGRRWARLRGLVQGGLASMLAAGVALALVGLAVVSLVRAIVPAASVYIHPLYVGLWLVPLQALLSGVGGIYRGLHQIGRAYAIPVWRHLVMLILMGTVWLVGVQLTGADALFLAVLAAVLVLVMQGRALWLHLPAPVREVCAAYEPGPWFRVSIPLLLVGGFVMVLNQTDIVMVGSVLGPREAGLYRAASRTAGLVGLVPIAVSAAADPMIARLYAAGDQARLQRLASVVVRWSTGMAGLTVVFFGLAGRLVLTLFGSEFVDAYGVLLILAGGQVGYAGVGLAAGLLNLTGHQQEGMVVFGGGAVLNIALNAAGLALWDSKGAALATATATVVTGLALWYRARRKVGVDASFVYALRRQRPG